MKSNENWKCLDKYEGNELVKMSVKHFHIQSLAIGATIQLRVIEVHVSTHSAILCALKRVDRAELEPLLTPEIYSNH